MSHPAPGSPHGWQRRLIKGALPHLITALITLGLAWLVVPRDRVVVLSSPTPTRVVVAAPTPIVGATVTPAPAVVRDMSRQELLDVKADTAALWSALYLSRGLAHLSDAEVLLLNNDLAGTAQTLVLLDDALQRAGLTAASNVRDPIEQIRRDVVAVRQDLYMRPNGLDKRLRRVRQALLTLIGNPNMVVVN